MDLAYLKQFKADKLRQRLLKAANLDRLEQLLSQEGAELDKLNQAKSELNLKQTLRPGEIDEAFSRIQRDVSAFLQVSDIPAPSLATFSLFDGTNGDIIRSLVTGLGWLAGAVGGGTALYFWKTHRRNQGKPCSRFTRRVFLLSGIPVIPGAWHLYKGGFMYCRRANDAAYLADRNEISYGPGRGRGKTVLFIAHEYVHHVQRVKGFYYQQGLDLRAALEGHARGVDRHLARLYSDQLQMRGYLFHQLNESTDELLHAYLWICAQLGRSPDSALLGSLPKPKVSPDRLSAYGLGNSLFRIYAQTQGEQIYADIVNGRFVFPDELPA